MVQVASVAPKGLAFAATPDLMPLVEAEVLARALARWEPSDAASKVLADRAADARAGQDFLDLFGIEDARTWDPSTLWAQMAWMSPSRLRVPLGKNPTTGKVVWLDLKQFADGGQGPHGMLTGFTGSGKSETLVSLVAALAMMHPPEMLQLLMGDFKGEATFLPLARLPHNQGLVSNLADSEHRLDRFEDAVHGEVMRRQLMVKEAGYIDVRDYEKARATTRPELEPIGALLIVLDEFSELLRVRPGLAEVFDTVGRVGRALSIHILNASQRAEVGKMAGLISQQTYSIGLKVKDAGQSRQAIGSNKAYEALKGSPPGSGFLVFEDEHERFRSYYVSAPFIPPQSGAARRRRTDGQAVDAHRFGAEVQPLPLDIEVIDDSAHEQLPDPEEGTTVDSAKVVQVLVDRMAEAGKSRPLGHRLWLPPLDEITELPVDVMAEEFWGRSWRDVQDDRGLVVPIGRGDDPFKHAQDLVQVDLSGAGGNVAIVGATQSGKSTAVRTLMMSLALSHSPQRVQFYAVDLGGGSLSSMAGLPHVAGVAGQGNEERIRRVFSEIERLLRFRTRMWEQAGLDLTEFRARKFRRKAGEVPEDHHGDVFFIIDGLRVLHGDMELSDRLQALIQTSLNYGIHVVVTNDDWIGIHQRVVGKMGTRLELRMSDPVHSEMKDRKAAAVVPIKQPGRALQFGGQHMMLGAPVVGGRTLVVNADDQDESSQNEAVRGACAEIAELWAAKGVAVAPALRTLPSEIGFGELGPVSGDVLKLGIGETEMAAVGVDFGESPHFYAVGSTGAGRTSVLRTLLASIEEKFTPEEATVLICDPGLALADAIDPRYLKYYINTIPDVMTLATGLASKLEERRPPPGLAGEQLARWQFGGERVFLVIDDITLLNPPGASLTQSILMPLVPAIQQGRQIRFHVLATASSQNWAAGGSNKIIQAMNMTGAGVLVMDGPRERIIGEVKAGSRPPGRGELVYRKAGNQMVQVALPPARRES